MQAVNAVNAQTQACAWIIANWHLMHMISRTDFRELQIMLHIVLNVDM